MESDQSYHQRRAAMQRALAERCGNPRVARSHVMLAELHEARAGNGTARPTLRVVMPG